MENDTRRIILQPKSKTCRTRFPTRNPARPTRTSLPQNSLERRRASKTTWSPSNIAESDETCSNPTYRRAGLWGEALGRSSSPAGGAGTWVLCRRTGPVRERILGTPRTGIRTSTPGRHLAKKIATSHDLKWLPGHLIPVHLGWSRAFLGFLGNGCLPEIARGLAPAQPATGSGALDRRLAAPPLRWAR